MTHAHANYLPYSPSIERHAYSARIANYLVQAYLSAGHPANDSATITAIFDGNRDLLLRADHLRAVATALTEAADAIDRARGRTAGATRMDELPADGRSAVQPAGRFQLLAPDGSEATDETEAVAAIDMQTGLTWTLNSSPERLRNDGPAEQYAHGLTTAGHTDWRLPTEDELRTLVYESVQQGAMVPSPFRAGVKPNWHWSSSPVPGDPGYARIVSFGYGDSSYARRSVVCHVLACRGGVAPAGVSPGQ